jgi:hypothetical protein
MHLNRGDRVKFLNDTGGGTITAFRDEKTAMVMTADGFEMPVPVKELILAEKRPGASSEKPAEDFRDTEGQAIPVYRRESRKDDEPEKADTGRKPEREAAADLRSFYTAGSPSTETGNAMGDPDMSSRAPVEHTGGTAPERNLLLAFVETGKDGKFEAWLINDSGLKVLCNLMIRQDEYYRTLKAGMMEADTKIFIAGFDRDQLNAFVSFRLQALFFLDGMFPPVSPSQREVEVDPAIVYGEGLVSGNEFFEEKACIIPVISDAHERETRKISEQEVARIISEKDLKPQSEVKKEKTDPLIEEVDLHIEEIVDDHAGMSGREVLEAQMSRFITALEGAIRGKTRRIIFIHGVGNGKLKYELRKTLDRKYQRLKYQDASFREYGYGATMVIVR